MLRDLAGEGRVRSNLANTLRRLGRLQEARQASLQARDTYLAYRRDGGESHTGGALLVAEIARLLLAGERRARTRLRRCRRNPAAARPPGGRRALSPGVVERAMEVIGAIVVAALSCAQCKGWFITQRRGIGTRSTLQALHVFLVLIPLDMLRETRRDEILRTVIEPPTFQKQAAKLWSEDERLAFIDWIAANPLAGDVIPGAEGARKVRWSRAGSGKSGGARVIYFNLSAREVVLLVAAYGKAERSNMLPVEIDKVV